jgi:hypothetical protein
MSAPPKAVVTGADRPRDAGTGSLKGDDMASCQVMGPAASKLDIAARTGTPRMLNEQSYPLAPRP